MVNTMPQDENWLLSTLSPIHTVVGALYKVHSSLAIVASTCVKCKQCTEILVFLQASSFSTSTSIGVIIIIVLYALDNIAVFDDTVRLLCKSIFYGFNGRSQHSR